jgi:hypothetical protein
MPHPASLQLRATARIEGESLFVDYAIEHLGGPPVLVCHLDYYYGRPHGVVGWLGGRLGADTAVLYFGTVTLPLGMNAAMMPRTAASPLASGGAVGGTLPLPLPLIETAAVAMPMPTDPVEPVQLRRMIIVVEHLLDEGGPALPKTPGGGLDPFARKTPREHLHTQIDLPPGVSLLPLAGGTSTIAHAFAPKQ